MKSAVAYSEILIYQLAFIQTNVSLLQNFYDQSSKRHIWISHVTYEWVLSHMNESCHIWMNHVQYEWVMSHMNESYHAWMSHVPYTREWSTNPKGVAIVTYEQVMSHMNESCHIWVMSHINDSCCIWMGHVPCESCPIWVMSHTHLQRSTNLQRVASVTHERVMSHMSHVTMIEPCHTDVISQMSHVKHESCRIWTSHAKYGWVMSPMRPPMKHQSKRSSNYHIWSSHVT